MADGKVAGRTLVLGVPAPGRVVRAFDRATGVQVASTTSDGAGQYEFLTLDAYVTHFLVAFDNPGGYDAVAHDRIIPELLATLRVTEFSFGRVSDSGGDRVSE